MRTIMSEPNWVIQQYEGMAFVLLCQHVMAVPFMIFVPLCLPALFTPVYRTLIHHLFLFLHIRSVPYLSSLAPINLTDVLHHKDQI
jgi:hypothetical protein